MARSICRAKNCYNTKYIRPDLSFFRFPKDEKRSKLWLESVAKPGFSDIPTDSLHRNNYICAEHFESHCFMNNHRRSLVHNAVPTLYKGKEEEDVSDILSTLQDPGHIHETYVEESDQLICESNLLGEAHHTSFSVDDALEYQTSEPPASVSTLTAGSNDYADEEAHFRLSGNVASSTSTSSERSCVMSSLDSSMKQVKRKSDNASPVYHKQMVIYVPPNQTHNSELFTDSLCVDSLEMNHEVSSKQSSDQGDSQDSVGVIVQLGDFYKELKDKSSQTDLTLGSLSQLEKECTSLRRALTMICHRRLVIKKSVSDK